MEFKEVSDYTSDEVVELFIRDCLLPTRGRGEVMSTRELFEYYVGYCQYAEQEITSRIHFGRCMAKRFKPSRRQGVNHYYCELNSTITV